MTSLERQLQSLRTPVARQLTVERPVVSLLFEVSEAKKLDREVIHKIGLTGLHDLTYLNPDIEEVADLFDESNLNFNRMLLSKEENESLTARLNKVLILLSPYMQHSACQQALELLVYRYQIHAFNAEEFLVAFLPYHETNFYGRILGALQMDFATSNEWAFLTEFAKKKFPVPFKTLVKNAMTGTHSIISRLQHFILNAVQEVGGPWLDQHAPLLFTLYAKLILAVLDNPNDVTDQLLSRIVPMIATGVKSDVVSLRNSALMVVCKLAVTVRLADTIASSLLKILLLKLKPSAIGTSLSTVVVVCQHQNIDRFSKKAVLKLLRNEEEFGFWSCLTQLASQTDLACFLEPFWKTLIEALEPESDDFALAHDALLKSLEVINSGEQSAIFINLAIQMSVEGKPVDSDLSKQIYSLAARFPAEFDLLHSEWVEKDSDFVSNFVKQCGLEPVLEVRVNTEINHEAKEADEQKKPDSLMQNSEVKRREQIANEVAKASEYSQRREFSGDPLKKATKWIAQENWEKVEWAFEEMSARPFYLTGKPEEDVEEFLILLSKHAANKTLKVPLSIVRTALVEAPVSPTFVVSMLERVEDKGSSPKKGKTVVKTAAKPFADETAEEWERRVSFSLEILNVKTAVPVTANLLSTLFAIVKTVDTESDKPQIFFIQQLAITLLIKLLKNPGDYKVTAKDLHMDCVVDTLRSTHSHLVLRDALRLLTQAVQLAPSSVTAHVMSVFTFMGSGLLRKDNELTLGIIEDTLHALLHAVVIDAAPGGQAVDRMRARLVDVVRVLAASATDIPAHRRGRMGKAIARAVGHSHAWVVAAVLFEGYCSRWQRTTAQQAADKVRTIDEQDAFDDLALELAANYNPTEQLSVVLDLIAFAVRLGGDQPPPNKNTRSASVGLDSLIFDRTKYTVPKLRHFRFVVVGLAVKVLSNRSLYEKLSAVSDELLYEQLVPIAKKLLLATVDLDEFVQKETDIAAKTHGKEQTPELAQTHRYWVALGTRAETVSEKLRFLLPGSVSARLIALVLEDKEIGFAMREKALALCNTKLLHDGFFSHDSGIHEQQLTHLAAILNGWIGPEKTKEKMIMCQNAAFSLKLIAKRLPKNANSEVLAQTMKTCTATAAEWNTLDEMMTGNILLLAGELIRSHNMGTTMLSAESLLKNCLSILNDGAKMHKERAAEEKAREEALNKRQRMRQVSLSGRQRGSDTLLICALTCIQRIMDQFAPFIAPHLGAIILNYCRLMARFCDPEKEKEFAAQMALGVSAMSQQQQTSKHTIQYRLYMVRSAILSVEWRLLPSHLAFVVKELQADDKSVSALFSLLAARFDPKDAEWLSRQGEVLVKEIYLPALEFRSVERKPEAFETVAHLEKAVFNSLVAMAEVLTENQLKPIVAHMVEWGEAAFDPNADYNTRLRIVILLHFANTFYESFNSLALPYFHRLLELSAKVLKQCNAAIVDDPNQLLLTGKKNSVEGLETDFAISQALDFVANCAKHPTFFTEDRALLVCNAVVAELENTKVAGHETRCVPHLADAVYHISESHNNIFLHLLNDILLKTRNNRPKIRYRVLLVLERLFDRIGDSIAPQLPIIMPFLSELLEDENKSVEELCDRVVRLLQLKFGSTISEGFV